MRPHHCTDAGCPYLGEASNRACRCHKSGEQVLREQRDELLEALREAIELLDDCEIAYPLRWESAIAKATGAA